MRVAVAVLGMLLAGCSHRDTFFVDDAELADADYLRTLKPRVRGELETRYGVQAHRIEPGVGTVLGLREFNPGGWSIIDDETFLKVTIWARAPVSGDVPLDGLSSDVVVLYTRGGSAWPETSCSGYVTGGTLRIEPRGAATWVRVEGILSVASTHQGRRDCDGRAVVAEFEAREIDVGELTPWLGKEAEHVYRETYRPGL